METARDLVGGILVVLAAVVAVWVLGHWTSAVLAQVQIDLLSIGRSM